MFVLDTEIARQILDGELWSREPGRVIPYHTHLEKTLFHSKPKMFFSDLTKNSAITPMMNAWKWANEVIDNQKRMGIRLVVTPTARAELMEAGQVCCKVTMYMYVYIVYASDDFQ